MKKTTRTAHFAASPEQRHQKAKREEDRLKTDARNMGRDVKLKPVFSDNI
jgi:hypothetical protein